MLKILFVTNTVIGRRGNIGYRVEKIIKELEPNECAIISREGYRCNNKESSKIYRDITTQIFRLLNAIRIYFWRDFPQKVIERNLFYAFFLLSYLVNRRDLKLISVVYLTELSPKILSFFQKRDIKVILDLPIAPSAYVENLNKKYGKLLAGNPSELGHEMQAIRNADHILVPSEFVKNEVLKIYPLAPVNLIPFGVNIKKFLPKLDIHVTQSFKFAFAGNISRRKGVIYLLKAWIELIKKYPQAELHLCGRLYPEANELIKKHNLHKSVLTPGFVDVSEYFSLCDVYVFPSLMEGSSKSIYEAMSCGLPVITTFESGSVVRDGVDGVIIPKCSSDHILEALLKFCSGEYSSQSMSVAARENIINYPWSLYSSRVIDVIRSFYQINECKHSMLNSSRDNK